MDIFFSIIFDTKNNIEVMTYYRMVKLRNENCYESQIVTDYEARPFGAFLFDFVEMNFKIEENFNAFVSEYCFESLYRRVNKSYKHDPFKPLKLTEIEYKKALKKMYKLCKEDFIEYNEEFFDALNIKERYELYYQKAKKENPEYAQELKLKYKSLTPNDYDKNDDLEVNDNINIIELDLSFRYFPLLKKELFENAYNCNSIFKILYLTFWKLTKLKYVVTRCKNCRSFFIPDSNHDTKYCNYLFTEDKTCRELAPQLEYKKNLDAQPLLKQARTRYQSLEKSASIYGGTHLERYNKFKKEYNIKKYELKEDIITPEEFKNWLDSTKIRKKQADS